MVAEVHIFSALKMVASVQMARLMEQGEYAQTLAQLQRDRYGTRQLDELVAAQQPGKSFHGYVFKDLVSNENGGPIDNRLHYGLAAVPEKSGGGKSFLMLMDVSHLKVDEERDTGTGAGAEYYKTATPQSPLDAWPVSSALAKWEHIVLRSPQEGLAEANAMKETYDQGRR